MPTDEIFEIASAGLCGKADRPGDNRLLQVLWDSLLVERNGFFGYENALLIRPLSSCGDVLGVLEWNDANAWRRMFRADLAGHLFFAETAFGEQFSLTEDAVFVFDPEVAEFNFFASNLDSWVAGVMQDPNIHVGYGLAKQWQEINGPLRPGERLGPKRPFILGGDFSIDNLARIRDSDLMAFRAQLANQIRDLPDGAEIKLNLIP